MNLIEATMSALQGKLEARSHKEDNEKAAPRTSIEKEYMYNNADFGIYNAKNSIKIVIKNL